MYLSIIPYVWDTRISDEVYRVRIISCEMIYLILFVGWGLVFDGISYPCGLMITRYIGLLGLVVGFSFPFLF